MPSLFVMRRPVASGVRSDNFNRANSTSNVNPASDGGIWTVDNGTWGISSNRSYISTVAGVGSLTRTAVGSSTISTDTGSSTVDITITNTRANTAGFSEIVFSNGGDRSVSDSLLLRFDSNLNSIMHSTGPSTLTNLGGAGLTAWTGGSTTIRITYNPSTGVVKVYQGGVLKTTITVPAPQRTTGTIVAFGSQVDTAGEFWDDFSVV